MDVAHTAGTGSQQCVNSTTLIKKQPSNFKARPSHNYLPLQTNGLRPHVSCVPGQEMAITLKATHSESATCISYISLLAIMT